MSRYRLRFIIMAAVLLLSLVYFRYVIYRRSFGLYAKSIGALHYEISLMLSRQRLRQEVLRSYPQLEDGALNDWQKVNLLREWVYKNTNACSPELNINDRVATTEIMKIFSAFSREKAGVDCGGVSNILMRVYNAFGYDSYLYIAGREEKYHHVVTLVKVPYKGKNIITLQDGLLNLTYTDANGDPHDIAGLFQSIRDGKWETVKTVQPKAVRKFIGTDSGSINNSWYGGTIEKQLSDTEYIVSNPPLSAGHIANLPFCRTIYSARFNGSYIADFIRIHAACEEI